MGERSIHIYTHTHAPMCILRSQVAQRDALRNILNQAYARNPDLGVRGVDDETVELLLRPGLDPRAVHVFLDFISYRQYP